MIVAAQLASMTDVPGSPVRQPPIVWSFPSLITTSVPPAASTMRLPMRSTSSRTARPLSP